jgi:hypothetical protein
MVATGGIYPVGLAIEPRGADIVFVRIKRWSEAGVAGNGVEFRACHRVVAQIQQSWRAGIEATCGGSACCDQYCDR